MWTPLLALLWVAQDSEVSVVGPGGEEAVTVKVSPRFAGAICSLTWHGFDFIDSTDHGRLLQSAANFDAGSPITDETFNPTEGGSRDDAVANTSTSRVLSQKVKGNTLETSTQMAFWLAPGQMSGDHLAKNTTVLSDHILRKRVIVGAGGQPRHVHIDVTFLIPAAEKHTQAVFESLTGYMPATCGTFWQFDAKTKKLKPLHEGPGEQPAPVVFASAGGEFAMGVIAHDKGPVGYGRWSFPLQRVTKWNCVSRRKDPKPGSSHSFSHDLYVGTLAQVEGDLAKALTR